MSHPPPSQLNEEWFSGELIEPNIVVFEVLGTNSESRMNVWMNVGEPSSNLTTYNNSGYRDQYS